MEKFAGKISIRMSLILSVLFLTGCESYFRSDSYIMGVPPDPPGYLGKHSAAELSYGNLDFHTYYMGYKTTAHIIHGNGVMLILNSPFTDNYIKTSHLILSLCPTAQGNSYIGAGLSLEAKKFIYKLGFLYFKDISPYFGIKTHTPIFFDLTITPKYTYNYITYVYYGEFDIPWESKHYNSGFQVIPTIGAEYANSNTYFTVGIKGSLSYLHYPEGIIYIKQIVHEDSTLDYEKREGSFDYLIFTLGIYMSFPDLSSLIH